MDPIWISIAVLVFVAYTIQTVTGFGAGVVLLTTGSFLLPIHDIIAVMVPLSLMQTGWISWRHRKGIDWTYAMLKALPLMAMAMVATFWWSVDLPSEKLIPVYGAFVMALAGRELWVSRSQQAPQEISSTAGVIALLGAGAIHGVYATGGPLVVYAAGRRGYDKQTFRSTITVLWLVISTVLLVQLIWAGRYSAPLLTKFPMVVWGLPAGIWLGERIFKRVDEDRFRRIVFGFLGIVASLLLFR